MEGIVNYQLSIANYLEKHGFERMEPKAVLFDMDGVLYDSMPHHAVAWQQSMATFGIHMTEADAYATEGARGIDTIRNMVRQQRGEEITLERAQEMYDEKTRLFHAMGEAKIMPGVKDLMGRMHRQGLHIGVVTGSGQRPLINRLLTDFGDYLNEQHIVTAYDVSHGKPNPDPYLMGLQKMSGLQPWQAIVVENAPLGVKAGTAARIFTIAVNTGPLPDNILLEAGADMLFPKMTVLAEAWETLSQNWTDSSDL
jgi:HAD superfamily hydrolase (TIGR01509 family)